MLELMELLRADPEDQGLRTAALLRRSHPFDKELQIAGLVHRLGRLLRLSDESVTVGVAAESIRPLLGERVARLVRLQSPRHRPTSEHGGHGGHGGHRDSVDAEAVATLCQARDSAAAAGLDAGVLEDWQPLLELVAAGSCRVAPSGKALDPLGAPRGSRRR
ncbi:metal-dependent phosphohydrolase [Streptomyces spororaveus]|uniref:metal-dependent phosphohydrolase n=1 Tax=Streptomyces spororaveus TaxID=284039 RepID=UPI0020797E23|nr:metal-dependent phosphohydrolase [Streptomyces spororaveus]MCM9083342.1 metal-dependent phosphohydrolase [Streptomyces spororaveus]